MKAFCCSIVILIIAMIIEMIMVMINVMVTTYRRPVDLAAQRKQYVHKLFLAVHRQLNRW